ncbi:hypothetical protein [Sorangium sp. So ce1078]|uniref:hypothetical protein n=1 Tax=Sorangium sp. So ce1078 TaxID=3133329 RepID=UPI003F609229
MSPPQLEQESPSSASVIDGVAGADGVSPRSAILGPCSAGAIWMALSSAPAAGVAAPSRAGRAVISARPCIAGIAGSVLAEPIGLNENTGASGRSRPGAPRAPGARAPTRASFAGGASAGAGVDTAGSDTCGRPLGGVGGATRASRALSRRPQS